MNNLILVNAKNPLPKEYKPKGLIQDPTTKVWIKEIVYKDFLKMNKDIQREGLSSLVLISGYRPYDYQLKLFNKKVDQFIKEGQTKQDAINQAATIVAMPGTSEHQTGLAIDITNECLAQKEDPLIEDFDKTEQGKWLNLYAQDFGFILRYPKDKIHITCISYEPWHYRFVGIYHSKKIKKAGICLEEYNKILGGTPNYEKARTQ